MFFIVLLSLYSNAHTQSNSDPRSLQLVPEKNIVLTIDANPEIFVFSNAVTVIFIQNKCHIENKLPQTLKPYKVI
jgi:hypothetical protein